MKIIIATDSYKHCLSSRKAGEALARGWCRAQGGVPALVVPVADGGEGTVDALVDATGGEYRTSQVHDPLMRMITARWGMLGDQKTAVIEMSAASGIELLQEDELDPSITTTYGTGELIREALEAGCRKIILGLGGSGTNDAGAGMFCALGGKIVDAQGKDIYPGGGALVDVDRLISDGLDERLQDCEIIAASDVNNPLTGGKGASKVYGPQKGADDKLAGVLDANLRHFADIVRRTSGIDFAVKPGAGAAGGLGFGLMSLLGAELMPGFEVVSKVVALRDHIRDATLVITGEGKMDGQTRFGKTPMGVCRLAREFNIPVVGVAGTLAKGYELLYDEGFTALISISDRPMDLRESMERATELLEQTGFNLGRLFKNIF